MRKLFSLLALLCLVSLSAFAQASVPDQGTLDLFSSFDRDIHTVLDGLSPVLISYVMGPLNKVAVAVLVCVLASEGIRAVTSHQILNIDYLIKGFFLPYGFALVALKNWNTPILGFGHSFVGAFTDTAQEIAAYIDLSAMKILFQKCGEIQQALGDAPSFLDSGFGTYWIVMLCLIALKGVVFIVISSGYVGLGVGAVIGPLFVFFYLVPPTRHLWHSWVGAMIKYSFYFIIAAIVTDIWCLLAVDYINNSLHGVYDLEHFMALTASLPAVLFATFLGVLRVPALANDFTSGHSNAGHGVVGGLIGFVRGAFN